jgi:hypothetical protein
MRAAAIALLLFSLAPATASAVTLDEIVALSRAGVSETVLLALIDRDKSVFAIEPEQIVALKQAGISDAVVLAMLKSGRLDPPEPADGVSPSVVGPNLIIVGHGPDVPNTASHPYPVIYPLPRSALIPYTFLIQPPRPRIVRSRR